MQGDAGGYTVVGYTIAQNNSMCQKNNGGIFIGHLKVYHKIVNKRAIRIYRPILWGRIEQ